MGTSVVSWLAKKVGPTGKVLATDIDTSRLTSVARPPVEVRVHDVGTEEPPMEGFDLVHARLVLVHVPDRERALRSMVKALRPGGRLLIEDGDPALQPLLCPDEHGPEQQLANRLRHGFPQAPGRAGAPTSPTVVSSRVCSARPGCAGSRPTPISPSPHPPARSWSPRRSARSAANSSERASRPTRRSTGTWRTSPPEAWTWPRRR